MNHTGLFFDMSFDTDALEVGLTVCCASARMSIDMSIDIPMVYAKPVRSDRSDPGHNMSIDVHAHKVFVRLLEPSERVGQFVLVRTCV